MTTTLSDLLKQTDITQITANPEDTVQHAANRMADSHIRALLVVRENTLCGIFTERDLVMHIAAQRDLDTPLAVVATKSVIEAQGDDSIEDAMRTMSRSNIHHLPVRDEGQILGIVSLRELVSAAYSEDEQQIEYLNQYIYGPC